MSLLKLFLRRPGLRWWCQGSPLYSTISSTTFLLRGGTKTYSSGSLDFRDTFMLVLLFRGSYVWIKFRDVAPQRRVYRRSRKDEAGGVINYGKHEPRFKPPRERRPSSTVSLKFDHLPLGGYVSHREAEIVYQIAAFYRITGRMKLELRSEMAPTSSFPRCQSNSRLDKFHRVAARAKEPGLQRRSTMYEGRHDSAIRKHWCARLLSV